MSPISVKEARNHFKSLLDQVEGGKEISIVRRGKAVACLIPASRAPKQLPDLKAFRSSLKNKGKSLSYSVMEARRLERY